MIVIQRQYICTVKHHLAVEGHKNVNMLMHVHNYCSSGHAVFYIGTYRKAPKKTDGN
jgi:hypothetical protein